MSLADTLGKQVGPMPLGAWVAVVGGGLGISLYRRRHTASTTAASDTTFAPALSPPITSTYGAVGGNGVTTTTPTVFGAPAPQTNDEWARLAVITLIGHGFNAGLSTNAVQKYIDGQPQSAEEGAVIEAALRYIGPPPTLPNIAVTPPPVNGPVTPTTPPPPQATAPPSSIVAGGDPHWCASTPSGPLGGPLPYLTIGSNHSDVGITQQALARIGIPITDPSDYYGWSTAAGVALLQARYGVLDGVPGRVGRQTWCAISEIIHGAAFRSAYQ